MTKTIIIASLLGSFIVLALTTGLFGSIFMLLLFGKIPGTTLLIPPVIMLSLWGVFVLVTIAWLLTSSIEVAKLELASPAAKRRPLA